MHKTSHSTMDDHVIIRTTSALSTFPSLISVHYRIVRCLPPLQVLPTDPAFCHVRTSFSTCFYSTSVHTFLLLFIHLHLTWSINFVLHGLNGNLSAIFIFGTIKGILLQSIWHPDHILLSTCPSRSHPATHVPIQITSCYPRAHSDHILLSTCTSRSHPVIHAHIQITSCYPCAHPDRILLSTRTSRSHPVTHAPIHITSCYPRAHPDHILLSTRTSRSHHVIHAPIQITSCYPRAHPDHILLSTCPSRSRPVTHMPIQITSCQSVSDSVFPFPTFQAVTMVPTLHSPGIWWHVLWKIAASLQTQYMYSYSSDTAFLFTKQ